MKTQTLITLDASELDTILKGALEAYDKQIIDKIKKETSRIVRDNAVNIFCGKCDKNVLFDKEPTVFGSKNGSGKSNVYHMDCWKSL